MIQRSMRRLACMGLLFLLLLLCLASCTSLVKTYTYTEKHMRLSEPYSDRWVVNGNIQETEVGGHTYCFEPAIPKDTRAAFIDAQETLCAHLASHGIVTKGLRFVVLQDYINRSDAAEKTAYFNLGNQGSFAQVTATLQAVWGDYVNYGYVYALSDHVAGELGWVTDTPAESVDAKEFEKSPALLNMVYPCFSGDYATPEQRGACRQLSRACLADMTDPYAGEAAFMETVKAFAAAAGIGFTPTHLGFAFDGLDCPLKVRTRYVEVFRTSAYIQSTDRLPKEDDLIARFDTAIAFFEDFDNRAERLRRQFKIDDKLLVPVMLTDEIYGGYLGLFKPQGVRSYIELSDLYSLMHEYVHYLDYTRHIKNGGTTDDWSNWTHEVLTTYFSRYYNVLYRLKLAEAGEIIHPSKVICRPYEDEDDELLFRRIYLSTTPQKNELLRLLKTDYDFGAVSFGGYFAELYGEAALIECMMYPEKTPEFTEKTLDKIVDDWCKWIADTEIPKGSVVN